MKKIKLFKLLALFVVLLTSVSQMWATDYYLMKTDGSSKGTSLGKMSVSGSVATLEWTTNSSPNGSKFYVTTNTSSDAKSSVDYLCGSTTFNESEQLLYLYGTSNYNDAVTLSCTQIGTYRFEFNTSSNKIRCFYPKTLLKPGKYIYFDAHNESDWISAGFAARFDFRYYDSGSEAVNVWCAKSDTVENWVFYAEVPSNNYIGKVWMKRFEAKDGTEWNNANVIAASTRTSTTQNCLRSPNTGWSSITLTWDTYAPPVKSIALSHNVSPSGGDGSEGNPYLVPTGTSVTVTATPTNIGDPDITTSYSWDGGSYGATNTKVLSCSVGGNTYSTTVTCRNAISGTNSTTKSATVYYQAVSTPTLTLSLSSSTAVRGDQITLTATPANATTPTIYYEYSTSSTFASEITEINHKTGTTQLWTVPAGTDGTIYYLRAKMQVSSTWYYSSILTLTAYGKKTIHVKNTNNWESLYLYAWDGSGNLLNGDWPGKSGDGSNGLSCTNTGGQWWDVVITTQVSGFILNADESGDSNQTVDLSYSTYTDDRCLAIGTNSGKRTLSNTVETCPTAPTASTSAASSLTNTTATINGSVSNGNDAIFDYGFYWSKDYSTASALEANGAKVPKGTSDYTGSISYGLTSLTAGTTYYYIAYAENGQGKTLSSVTSFVVPYNVTISTATGCSALSPTAGSHYMKVGDNVSATAATGYTFSSWSTTNVTLSTPSTSEGVTTSSISSFSADNATIEPVYTANTYTVSFDVNGGTASTPDSKEVTYDAAYGTLPSGMTHASKTFVGWYTDSRDGYGDLITAETTVSTASNHTLYAHYENVYSVNVTFKCGAATVYPSTSVNASANSLMPTITAPEIFGYTFTGWTESGGSYVTFTNASAASTTIKTTGAATVVANYSVVPTVYFKNNLGWDSVFVSFDITWIAGSDGKDVPVNKDKPYYRMTQIGSTDIFYCEIPSTYTASNYASWSGNIAFDNTNYGSTGSTTHSGTWNKFYGGEFVGRGDFDPKATLYIPYNGDTETRNTCTFYTTGCWMNYNSTESGYQVNMNTWVTGSHDDTLTVKLEAANAGGYEFSATLNLTHPNYSYGFKLYKIHQKNTTDQWYTNTGAISAATDDLPWHFWAGSTIDGTTQRCELHTEALGDYKITVSFATGRPEVNVEYPTSVGDWRLAYNDRIAWSGDTHDGSWYLYSRVIKAKANAEDIVSFYVSKADGANAHIELQQCTAIDGGTGAETWTKQGEDLDISSIAATGFYNFKVTQDGSKVATAAYDGAYSGNFYIRTDASDGGWSNYKTGKNVMTYSEYAENNSGFTHYFMRYVTTGSNIKFCVANDYSDCLTEYCISDSYTNEYIEADGNVRFMWDQRTNKVSRAYISGSSIVSDRFLVLEGSPKMFNADVDGTPLTDAAGGKVAGLNEYEMKFTDDQNWIYEATIKAKPGANALLTAAYNGNVQYFGGSGPTENDSVLLLGGSDSNKYKIRIVYDFKTNRLIKAFIPDGDINAELSIEADMMIIREHQGDAQQITFGVNGKLTDVKTVYGAMKFNKYTVNGKDKDGGHAATGASRFERDLFYISFPFDVKLNEAFGFGTYGQHWIIEYYDGKGRAANGYWADSESNWKFVMPAQRKDFTMKAFEGYILALDLDEMTESSSIWNNNVQDVYVYFPSNGEVKDIEATNRLIDIDQDGYECTIGPRFSGGDDRTLKDSYWHCIGVPSFANYYRDLYDTNDGTQIDWSDDNGTIDWSTPSLPYLYTVDWSDNSLDVTTSATFSFKAMHSYMVQYAGTSIYWSQVNATPSSVVARERIAPTHVEFRIELQQDSQKVDQTFIRMTDDANVTTGFDFNYDLSKEFKRNKSNIYTLVTTVKEDGPSITQSAANVMPMSEQTTIIPVGVKIAANGEYTFSMPEGTNGGDVWLIDNANSSRTNLGLMDYTVNLTTGTYEGRFSLEFPVQNVVTEIENAANANANANADVRKVFVGGRLYILRDGKAYDATGAQVR